MIRLTTPSNARPITEREASLAELYAYLRARRARRRAERVREATTSVEGQVLRAEEMLPSTEH